MSQPSTISGLLVGALCAPHRILGFKWFLARLGLVAVYILIAGFEYNFGAMFCGGWFIFHLEKLTFYLLFSHIIYFMVKTTTRYNPRVVVLLGDIVLLPCVYLLFES